MQTIKVYPLKIGTFQGSKVKTYSEHAFGPILFSQYTLSKGILKLTAQMAPVILNNEKVTLQIKENSKWKTIKEAIINKQARTATFKIEGWDEEEDIPYRLAYKIDKGSKPKEIFYKEGTIRKDPIHKEDIVYCRIYG